MLLFLDLMFLTIGCGSFIVGYITIRKAWLIRNTPTSTVRGAALGFAEVSGFAGQKYPLTSPFYNAPCVFYKYVTETQAYNRRGQLEWREVSKGSSCQDFYVEDESGKLLVDPNGAEIILSGPTYVADSGILRNSEWYIKPGERIYVLGTIKKLSAPRDARIPEGPTDEDERAGRAGDDVIITKGTFERLFIITDNGEQDLEQSYYWTGKLMAIIGIILIVVMAISASAHAGLLPHWLAIPWDHLSVKRGPLTYRPRYGYW